MLQNLSKRNQEELISEWERLDATKFYKELLQLEANYIQDSFCNHEVIMSPTCQAEMARKLGVIQGLNIAIQLNLEAYIQKEDEQK